MAHQIESVLNDQIHYDDKQISGVEWSRKYTTDVFESGNKKNFFIVMRIIQIIDSPRCRRSRTLAVSFKCSSK
jgi:hypothetical protein